MLLVGADIEVLLAAPGYRGRDFVAALQDALPSTDLTTAPIQSPEAPALRRVVFDAPADAPGGDVPATPATLRQPVVGMTTEVRRFVPSADASGRSEGRRVGKAWVSTVRTRGAP